MSADSPKLSYPIGGKLVQGAPPTDNQMARFNAATNQWEFHPPNPLITRNLVDQTVNNSTVLVDAVNLVLNIPPVSNYELHVLMLTRATTVADIKFGWTGPGCTLTWGFPSSALTPFDITQTTLAPQNGSDRIGQIFGTLQNPGPATTLQFRFAQFVAEVSDCVLLANSFLSLSEITL